MNRLYALMLFLFSALWAQAQNASVSGRVVASDADNGPLPGVAIMVDGATRGTITNIEGDYTLPLEPGDSVLVFSFVGYKKQRVRINGQSTINVTMEPQVLEQNDVVIIGYGVQRKSDITGSISSVRGEDLVKVPSNNAMQALQGKAAGVQVSSNTGTPGDPPKIRIRGVGTLAGGSSPLFVVDGVFMRDISSINSQDIESIEVLKDASAAAIFGVEGANGVILVTTKKGSTTGKPTISASAEAGFQVLSKKIDLLNGPEFAQYYTEARPGDGRFNNPDAVPSTDWQDQIFSNNGARIQNYQVSGSGGGKDFTYYLGTGYFSQEGILPKSKYERVSLRGNSSLNVTDYLKVGTNLTIAPDWRQNPPSVILTAYRADPTILPDSNGRYNEVPTYGNPVAATNYSNSLAKGVSLIGNIFAELQLPAGFSYRFNYGSDVRYGKSVTFTPVYFVGTLQQNPISKLNTDRLWQNNWLIDNLLYWKKTIGKHNFDAMAATSVYSFYFETLGAGGQNIIRESPNLWYLNKSNGLGTETSQNVGREHRLSYFGRLNYTYNDRYLLTATYRVDGSSNFSKKNQWARFPSAALGWVASEEDFLKEVNFLDYLKLRASWGRLGNQAIGANQQYPLVEFDENYQGVLGNPEATVPGASLGKDIDPNLRWETTRQVDAGIEFGFLKNRLTLELDYYNRKSFEILVEISRPGYEGNGPGTKIFSNAATVTNSGFEFNIGWRDKIGEVGYRINALGTTVKNNVNGLGASVPADEFIIGGSLNNGQNVTRTQAGQPIGAFYGYKVVGVFQNEDQVNSTPHISDAQPGDLIYQNTNGDSVLDDRDRVFLGSPIPKFIFGFSMGVNWRGFDFSADFQGQTGNMIYNGKAAVWVGPGNVEGTARNRWTGEGTSNTEPRANFGVQANNQISNYYLQKGDFLRLRSLTLSKSFSKAEGREGLIGKFGQSISIFIRGTNIFTLTKYTGYSPEIGGLNSKALNDRERYKSSDFDAGIDLGTYPVTSVYTGGINLSF